MKLSLVVALLALVVLVRGTDLFAAVFIGGSCGNNNAVYITPVTLATSSCVLITNNQNPFYTNYYTLTGNLSSPGNFYIFSTMSNCMNNINATVNTTWAIGSCNTGAISGVAFNFYANSTIFWLVTNSYYGSQTCSGTITSASITAVTALGYGFPSCSATNCTNSTYSSSLTYCYLARPGLNGFTSGSQSWNDSTCSTTLVSVSGSINVGCQQIAASSSILPQATCATISTSAVYGTPNCTGPIVSNSTSNGTCAQNGASTLYTTITCGSATATTTTLTTATSSTGASSTGASTSTGGTSATTTTSAASPLFVHIAIISLSVLLLALLF